MCEDIPLGDIDCGGVDCPDGCGDVDCPTCGPLADALGETECSKCDECECVVCIERLPCCVAWDSLAQCVTDGPCCRCWRSCCDATFVRHSYTGCWCWYCFWFDGSPSSGGSAQYRKRRQEREERRENRHNNASAEDTAMGTVVEDDGDRPVSPFVGNCLAQPQTQQEGWASSSRHASPPASMR